MEQHFQEKIPIETHSRKNFATYSYFEKFQGFFWKKPIYFSKKPKF